MNLRIAPGKEAIGATDESRSRGYGKPFYSPCYRNEIAASAGEDQVEAVFAIDGVVTMDHVGAPNIGTAV